MARTTRPQNIDQLIADLAEHSASADLGHEIAQVRQLRDGPSVSKVG